MVKVIMVKGKRKPLEGLKKVGAALRDIAVASTSHPTTAALTLLALTVIVRPLTDRDEKMTRHLDGLFATARDLAVAASVAPIAVGAFGVIGQALQRRKAPEKT